MLRSNIAKIRLAPGVKLGSNGPRGLIFASIEGKSTGIAICSIALKPDSQDEYKIDIRDNLDELGTCKEAVQAAADSALAELSAARTG